MCVLFQYAYAYAYAYAWMDGWMDVCTYVCMHACMYVFLEWMDVYVCSCDMFLDTRV